MIAGIDEVGRGAWAGPLVVGAAVCSADWQLDGLADSKVLTKRRRELLAPELREQLVWYGLGWVESFEVDKLGLQKSLFLATRRALEGLPSEIDRQIKQIIVDGTVDFCQDSRSVTLKKADQLIPAVSAAAVLAKVARDHHMIELSHQSALAGYGFERHVGYGTKIHRQALADLGVSEQHRLSFEPMLTMTGWSRSTSEMKTSQATSTDLGQAGEELVAQDLQRQGLEVLAKNWRTAQFEIDLVAENQEKTEIWLVEVKTRKNNYFGGGAAALDQFKLAKMNLAAEVVRVKYPDRRLKLIGVTVLGQGDNLKIDQWFNLV